jgi:hypothetical protein
MNVQVHATTPTNKIVTVASHGRVVRSPVMSRVERIGSMKSVWAKNTPPVSPAQ